MPRPAENDLVQTKLRAPTAPRHEIARPRIVAMLDHAATCRVVGVYGRAGTGKTTAMAQWVRERAPSAHWCTVDTDDNSASRFWRHVLAAPALHDLGAEALAALDNGGGRPAFEDQLPTALSRLREDAVIVLDDIDSLTARDVLDSFETVIERAPTTLRVVVAGRSEPHMPAMERLRTRGEANLVGDDGLGLHDDEARALLDELGVNLSAEQLAALLARTEGWITGVRLAGLSLRDRGAGATPAAIGNGHAETHLDDVFDYLRDEVLLRVPAHVREFMLQTSIVDRLHSELCDVLTDQSTSADVLDELRRNNLVLNHSDGDPGTFRYHTLMRELLEAELERTSSARHRQLHTTAAEWFERSNDSDAAMRHWFRAGRADRAWERFGDSMIGQFTRGPETTLQGWTRLLPHDMKKFDARQALGLATALIFLGSVEEARSWTQRVEAEQQATDAPDALVEARLTFVQHLLEFADGNLLGAVRLGTRAHQLLEAAAPTDWERMRAPLARARLLSLLGQHERARETVESFAAWLDEHDGWLDYDRVSFPAALAGIALAAGNVVEASDLANEALANSDGLPRTHISIAEAHYVVGAVARERRESESARASLDEALTLADGQAFAHLKVAVRIALAQLEHTLGNATRAEQLLTEARALISPTARILQQRVDDAVAALKADGARSAADVLTAREQEVWRYLATGMSMREIAEVLFISRNTLKSHVRNIYQKLDVKNREEAVELQRTGTPDHETTRSSRS
jgi:LuxR family maltose regulon positive regulatory protein